MRLELKHLAPYLPYGLKFSDGISIHTLDEENLSGVVCDMKHLSIIKPILRPQSDLTKEIEINEESFVPMDWLNENKSVNLVKGVYSSGDKVVFNEKLNTSNIRFFEYCIIEKLFEWHFDVFGLIKKGLAIDINTL